MREGTCKLDGWGGSKSPEEGKEYNQNILYEKILNKKCDGEALHFSDIRSGNHLPKQISKRWQGENKEHVVSYTERVSRWQAGAVLKWQRLCA